MKNLILILCGLILTSQLNAQQQINKLVPQSPNAASLGKYGDVNVSLYTGQVSPKVPIYEIKFNDFTFPILLSYSSSGLKLHDYPSWVGMGWTLGATGVINRQVKGIPDETTHGFVGSMPTATVVKSIANSATGFAQNSNYPLILPMLLNEGIDLQRDRTRKKFIGKVGLNFYDGEPDMFTFTAGGLSGKFFFDETAVSGTIKQPVLVPRQPLSVKGTFANISKIYNIQNTTGVISKFEIKNANGVKYTFAVAENNDNTTIDPLESGKITNAWYLSEILTLNGNKLTFTYTPRMVEMPHTVTESKYLYNVGTYALLSGQGVSDPDIQKFADLAPHKYNYNTYNPIYEQVLTKITINDGKWGEVLFNENTEIRNDWCQALFPNLCGTNQLPNAPKSLKEIIVKDGKGVEVKKFSFEYDNTANRLLLQKVKELGTNITETLTHSFEYNQVSDIPFLPSTLQNVSDIANEDHWGYYTSNTSGSLLPNYLAFTTSFEDVYIIDGKNREPNVNKALIGQLNKINYPTGGYSTFAYEPNEYFGKRRNSSNSCSGNVAIIAEANLMANSGRTNNSLSLISSIPFSVTATTGCYQLSWSVNLHTDLSEDLFNASYSIIDNANGALKQSGNFQCNRNKVIAKSDNIAFGLESGNYTLVVDMSGDYIKKTNTSKINVKVEGIQNSNPAVDIMENKVAGGIRVRRTEDCPNIDGTNCLIKEYNYQDPLDATKSGGRLVTDAIYDSPGVFAFYNAASTSENDLDIIIPKPQIPIYVTGMSFKILNSSSQLAFGNTSGHHTGYKFVTVKELSKEIGTDGRIVEVDKGKSEFNYFSPDDYPDVTNLTYPYHSSSRDYRRGQVKTSFVYNSDSKVLKSSETQVAVIEPYLSNISIKAGKYWHNVDFADQKYIYDIRYTPLFYASRSDFQYTQKAISNDFFNVNNVVADKISTEVNYSYTNGVHLQPTTISTVNSKGQTVVNKIKYASELLNDATSNLQATAVLMNSLGLNVAPLQKETLVGGVRISLEKTFYSLFNSIPQVSRIEAFTGNENTLSTFSNFLQYDTYGNLVSFNDNSGVNRSLLWAYDGQYPVLKIENKTMDNIEANSLLTTWNQLDIDNKATVLNISGSLVSEYLYSPLIGVSTIVSPSGIKTFYNYDGLERLISIKDNNQKIVKSYQYNFKNQ